MKRCPKCASEYDDQANFCPNDATPLASTATEPKSSEALGGSVPTRGWTQVIEAVAAPVAPAATPDSSVATAAALGTQVPTRGWTQVIEAVSAPVTPAPETAAAPTGASSLGAPVPTRGWTQVIEAVSATPQSPAIAGPVPTRGWTQAIAAVDAAGAAATPAPSHSVHSVPTVIIEAIAAEPQPVQSNAPEPMPAETKALDDEEDLVPAGTARPSRIVLVLTLGVAIGLIIYFVARHFID